MARVSTVQGHDESAARLAELLRSDEKVVAAPEFRSALRERLVTAPPIAPAGPAAVSTAKLLALVAAAAGIVLFGVAVRRGAGPEGTNDRQAVATEAPALSEASAGDAASSGVSRVVRPTVGAGVPSPSSVMPSPDVPVPATLPIGAPRATEAEVTGGHATAAAPEAAAGGNDEASGSDGEPPASVEPGRVPDATEVEDAPEQTPRAYSPTDEPTATPEAATATPAAGLPSTPTAAPTGQGWPTLPPPVTPEPGEAGP